MLLNAKAAKLFFAVVAIFSVYSGTTALADVRKLIVIQDASDLNLVDLGLVGKSHGDLLAFEATIRSEAGHTGRLIGMLVTIDLPGESDPHEDRIGQLHFDLGNGDALMVAGATIYPGQVTEMAADAPQVRVVIGGTGKFIGARGQVTTTHKADGSYEHAFELVD